MAKPVAFRLYESPAGGSQTRVETENEHRRTLAGERGLETHEVPAPHRELDRDRGELHPAHGYEYGPCEAADRHWDNRIVLRDPGRVSAREESVGGGGHHHDETVSADIFAALGA